MTQHHVFDGLNDLSWAFVHDQDRHRSFLLVKSYFLQIEHKAILLALGWIWPLPSGVRSATSTWIFGGAFQMFSPPSFWSFFEGDEPSFKGEHFLLFSFWSGGGAFLCGEGDFLSFSGGGVFLGGDSGTEFSSGGGSFLEEGDLDFFFFLDNVGGSPFLGGNRAFMAEPSDRPAINDGLGGRKKGGCRDQKKGRNGEKNLSYYSI